MAAAAVVLPACAAAGLFPKLAAAPAGLLGAALLLSAIDAARGGGRLHKIDLRAPGKVRLTKDVPAALPLTILNGNPAALPLRLAGDFPEGIEPARAVEEIVAPPGASRFEWRLAPQRRGDHALGRLHLECPSPWGLWQMRATRSLETALRVYPNLRDRATAALLVKNAPGLRMRRTIGKGREFDNLRHYVAGDSFEDIHWKATARRAFPIVKLYRVEHAQEVYAVIDHSRLSARSGILDSYVEAALHLAIAVERQGDRFGLVTFSDRTSRFVRARGGLDHFRLCRETIYNLRAERVSPDFREVFTTLQLNLRSRALLVFFTSLDDALLAETFEPDVPLVARRHLVLVNVTRSAGMEPLFSGAPPEDLDGVYANLAGQMLWNRMRALELALGHRGVRLALVEPGSLKRRVAEEYAEVKRRQVL